MLLLTIPIGYYLVMLTLQLFTDIGQRGRLSANIADTRISIAYRLDRTRWLEFPLTGHAGKLRIITNAVVNSPLIESPDIGWLYALNYRLLDGAGRELVSGQFFHRTRIRTYRSEPDGDVVTQYAFLESDRVPTDSRAHIMPLTDSATKLMLKVRYMPTPLESISARIYEPIQYTEDKLDTEWNKLTRSQRKWIARGSVYTPNLLLTDERRNLLRNRWKPLGPAGVQGRDYRLDKLFIRQGELGNPLDKELLPAGLYMDGSHRAIVHLPEERTHIRLHFTPVRRTRIPQQEPITIRWYGSGVDKRDASKHIWTSLGTDYHQVYEGGLLEIVCSQPYVLRAYREEDSSWQEVTPDHSYLRIYALGPVHPVRYALAHMSSNDTPLRVDLRALMAPAKEGEAMEVDYRILDINQEVVKQGKLNFQSTPSVYDRLPDKELNERISEPLSFYFRIPSHCAAIEFRSHSHIWISAYTRPLNLIRRVRIPEDYYRDLRDTAYQPAWFIVKPSAEKQLSDSLRTNTLIVQRRPPVDDPEIVAGRYEWEIFRPQGRWRGRHLLTLRTSQLPLREEALASLFRPIRSAIDEPINLQTTFGRESVKPTLIYIRKEKRKDEYSLFLDGELFHQSILAATQGEIRLPPIKPGLHRLHLQSSSEIQWFINYADHVGELRLLRFSNRLEPNGMEFVYHKQSAQKEVLTGQFFSTARLSRAGLRVKVGKIRHTEEPQAAWTFTDRYYDLRINHNVKVPILGTKSQQASSGARFFLPLREDLEVGLYHIKIQPDPGVEGYLSLYRLKPGQSAKANIIVEQG
ncbi:MAG: hypothetical protein PVI92_07960 [Chromatiales bacterium]